MTAPHSFPGVFVEELSSRSRDIVVVDTSVAAFVGRTLRGPVNESILVASFADFERVFGGLWSRSLLGYSVRDFFEQGGTEAVVVRVHRSVPDDVATLRLGVPPRQIVLEAIGPGSWGSQLTATVAATPGSRGLVDLTVTDNATGSRESFRRVSLKPRSRRRLDSVLNQSALVRVRERLPRVLPGGLPVTSAAVGGSDGARLGATDFTAGPDMRQKRMGVYALEDVSSVGLVVVPPYSRRGLPRRVMVDTLAYAEERGAVMIVDSPPTWDTAEAAAAAVAVGAYPASANAAVYFPWILRPDPIHDGRIGVFPPSGAVAGVIARTDKTRGVWKAAAGVEATLNGVVGLAVGLGSQDIDRLNKAGINCLRTLPTSRQVIWGARTLSGIGGPVSEWKYLPVRRTGLLIEQSIERGIRWAVFEPNGETLWSAIRVEVGDFLEGLFRQGAFAGVRPEESYFLKCDSTTTTQNDRDSGVVNILVGFAPLKPAEFVVIRISQKTA